MTGSSRGIGYMLSRYFLENGAHVFGFSRSEPTIDDASYKHVKVDIGEPESVRLGFIALKEMVDGLDILINNAAVLTSQFSMIMPSTAASLMINTNLLGAFLVSRESSKMMRKNKWGRIINIGSMASSLEPVGDSVYAACKAGLITLSNVMAKELGALNITSNTIGVSAIKTDMLDQLPVDKINAVISTLPIARFAEPDDIYNVIDFYSSERSSYITAQTVYLGGVN